MRKTFYILLLFLSFNKAYSEAVYIPLNASAEQNHPIVDQFLLLLTTDDFQIQKLILKNIDHNWQEGYEVMLLELLYFSEGVEFRQLMLHLLQKKQENNMALTLTSGTNIYGTNLRRSFQLTIFLKLNYTVY